jgi:hypothetical protein
MLQIWLVARSWNNDIPLARGYIEGSDRWLCDWVAGTAKYLR